MQPQEAFLSHSSVDAAIAGRIAELLRRHGVPVFFSPHNILGARQWHDEIGDALRRCDWFILLLSPDAVASEWVKLEYMYALRKKQYVDRIVPILLKDCDVDRLSWTLLSYQQIDFTGDFETGCRELLRIWGIGLKQ